jgi:hypothetical protein
MPGGSLDDTLALGLALGPELGPVVAVGGAVGDIIVGGFCGLANCCCCIWFCCGCDI